MGFGQTADIDIVFDGAANRKMTDVKMEDGKKERQLLYYDGETVSGKVTWDYSIYIQYYNTNIIIIISNKTKHICLSQIFITIFICICKFWKQI